MKRSEKHLAEPSSVVPTLCSQAGVSVGAGHRALAQDGPLPAGWTGTVGRHPPHLHGGLESALDTQLGFYAPSSRVYEKHVNLKSFCIIPGQQVLL